jgi:hypothetical protein
MKTRRVLIALVPCKDDYIGFWYARRAHARWRWQCPTWYLWVSGYALGILLSPWYLPVVFWVNGQLQWHWLWRQAWPYLWPLLRP